MSLDQACSAPPSFTDDELAELSRQFESWSASSIIQWAVDNFAPAPGAHRVDDRRGADRPRHRRSTPRIEVVFIDTGYHFPETLETVEAVRRRYGLNLRMMTVAHHDEELWKVDPENCCSAVKVGQLDRALERQGGVDERPAPRRGRHPGHGPDRGPRPAGPRQGQPARHVDRPRRARATSPTTTSS